MKDVTHCSFPARVSRCPLETSNARGTHTLFFLPFLFPHPAMQRCCAKTKQRQTWPPRTKPQHHRDEVMTRTALKTIDPSKLLTSRQGTDYLLLNLRPVRSSHVCPPRCLQPPPKERETSPQGLRRTNNPPNPEVPGLTNEPTSARQPPEDESSTCRPPVSRPTSERTR